MALDSTASGVFPIAPTPFQFEGRLDHASIETLIAGYLKVGATGVTVLGIMGEAAETRAGRISRRRELLGPKLTPSCRSRNSAHRQW
jgi:hypothetical protein